MQAAQGKMSSSLATVSQLEELIALGYQQPAPPQEFTSTVLQLPELPCSLCLVP